MPTFFPRFDEHHLLDLAARARVQGCKRAYLHKSDSKLKKLTLRWCCIYQNMLFYFESESVPKPLGVVFLEGCQCRSVEQIGLPVRDIEGAFCISGETPSNKSHFFVARNDKERDDWIETLSNANMSKINRELEELRDMCTKLESQFTTKVSEVEHLRRAYEQTQEECKHLKELVRNSGITARKSSRLTTPPPSPKSTDLLEEQATVLQRYIRGWLIRRKWKKVVHDYLESPEAAMMKRRNQLMWKFVASEEDYVSQLTILSEEFKQHCEIASLSRNPPLTLEQCNTIFRNSDELFLFHQMHLRALHERVEKWPIVVFGDVMKLFIPMLTIYHHYIANHTHSNDLLLTLMTDNSFKVFLGNLERKPSCQSMSLESLLVTPLKRISNYITDLQELKAHTPQEHVDYSYLQDTITELEMVEKTVTEEASLSESIRSVLKVENAIEGGCAELLDKEQTLIRQGVLQQVRVEDRLKSPAKGANKLRIQSKYCFLFSKHLLVTTKVSRKDGYRLTKLLPLSRCNITDYRKTDFPELHYRGMRVECNHGNEETEYLLLLAGSINEKAQWMADFSQCVESEKQNKILQFQSIGEPVELNSKFIRYSTFRTGKEQLVNCGNLENLLQRLVKISYHGIDFLNTFLMTFPLYTNAHTVFDFLHGSYRDTVRSRERKRTGSLSPQDAVRDARAIHESLIPRSSTTSNGHLSLPIYHSSSLTPPTPRRSSESSAQDGTNISGIFFALKHWICKHFHHFRDDHQLAQKLECLLEEAQRCPVLYPKERNTAMDASRMYSMQREDMEENSPVLEFMNLTATTVQLPQKPFECLLLWSPRETAEQLCLIEGTLFNRIDNDEIIRYFKAKTPEKNKVAPHLSAIVQQFNRMSLFFMWSVASQRYLVDRTKILEFLIQVSWECYQLNNFSSLMQLMSALEHGSIGKYKQAWEYVHKNIKQQFRMLSSLSSTDGRFKELRAAMKKAQPPTVPYLGIVLSELSGVVEGLSTYVEGELINFTKMRRCTRLITAALQYQDELYEFAFVSEISKVLLCTELPGNEDDLYQLAQTLQEKI